MSWYFMRGEERMGPIEEAQFQALVAAGSVTAETYVWKQGMSNWQQWGTVAQAAAPAQPAAAQADVSARADVLLDDDLQLTAACAECGQTFDTPDMIRYGQAYVCADCKPVFFQRVKEGSALPQHAVYASFFTRLGAKILDGIILLIVNFGVDRVIGMDINPENVGIGDTLFSSAINALIGLAFTVFFLGKFGATPGKMAFGIRVVRPDGSRITYMRALGRTLAEYLSSIILLIGYIMAAFDEEHRTLHDRIADTRVVKK